MLKTILKSFSFGELANYIDSEDLKFIKALFKREITKENLIDAVEVSIGLDFIVKKQYRDLLISRMPLDIAESILGKAIDEIKKPKNVPENISNKYEFLKWIGDNYLNEFQAAMGFDKK